MVFAHGYFLTIIQNIIAVTSKIIRITVPPKGIVTANKVVVHLLANVVCWSVEIMNGSVKNHNFNSFTNLLVLRELLLKVVVVVSALILQVGVLVIITVE